MLAMADAPAAVEWYERALGARLRWSLGSVAGLEFGDGGPAIFVGQPENNGWETPQVLGMPSCRVEVFCDDPDAFVARALKQGASLRLGRKHLEPVRDHQMPWGVHRQGGFIDPFGHMWMVGDRSPLQSFG
jgi:uncharacterized glyoxalase superfamily protein PhnB